MGQNGVVWLESNGHRGGEGGLFGKFHRGMGGRRKFDELFSLLLIESRLWTKLRDYLVRIYIYYIKIKFFDYKILFNNSIFELSSPPPLIK